MKTDTPLTKLPYAGQEEGMEMHTAYTCSHGRTTRKEVPTSPSTPLGTEFSAQYRPDIWHVLWTSEQKLKIGFALRPNEAFRSSTEKQ